MGWESCRWTRLLGEPIYYRANCNFPQGHRCLSTEAIVKQKNREKCPSVQYWPCTSLCRERNKLVIIHNWQPTLTNWTLHLTGSLEVSFFHSQQQFLPLFMWKTKCDCLPYIPDISIFNPIFLSITAGLTLHLPSVAVHPLSPSPCWDRLQPPCKP